MGSALIHSDFRVILKTEDDYIPERQIYLGIGGNRIQPWRDVPPPAELEKFLKSGNEIVSNIQKKLQKLQLPSDELARLTRDLVSGYVVGQDELQTLNERFPSTYESVIRLKSAMQSQLAIRALSRRDNHGSILCEILSEYESKLTSDFSNSISNALIARLSTEAISDWLGRCPLDFPC